MGIATPPGMAEISGATSERPNLDPPGLVVWITGRPSSGKSTVAEALRLELTRRGHDCAILDSDEVRAAIVPAHDYTEAGRDAFYATLARLASLLARQSHIVLVPATAGRAAYRARARTLAPRFLEIYVDTPLAECEQRDSKGLYRAARASSADTLPGLGAPFEPPDAPDAVTHGADDRAALERVLDLIGRRVT